MKQFTLEDLEYEGSQDKKHCWNVPDGQPCYWQTDYLHMAEDLIGIHPKPPLDYPTDEIDLEDQAK